MSLAEATAAPTAKAMRGKRVFVEVPPRARLVVEVALAIDASNQRRGIAHFQLLDVGWNVADREPDTTIVGPVRLRAVHQLDVMQRHLAGLQYAIDGFLAVDLDCDLLPAREQVVLVKGVDVLQMVLGL